MTTQELESQINSDTCIATFQDIGGEITVHVIGDTAIVSTHPRKADHTFDQNDVITNTREAVMKAWNIIETEWRVEAAE